MTGPDDNRPDGPAAQPPQRPTPPQGGQRPTQPPRGQRPVPPPPAGNGPGKFGPGGANPNNMQNPAGPPPQAPNPQRPGPQGARPPAPPMKPTVKSPPVLNGPAAGLGEDGLSPVVGAQAYSQVPDAPAKARVAPPRPPVNKPPVPAAAAAKPPAPRPPVVTGSAVSGSAAPSTSTPPQSPAPTPQEPAMSASAKPAPNYTNRLAIAALVFSVLFVTAIAGVICGHVARKQIRETGEHGDALAIAALWIGYIGLAAEILALIGYTWIVARGS